MENQFIPPQPPRGDDDHYEDSDGVWEFMEDDRWHVNMGCTDEVDRNVIIATTIWESQTRALHRARDLAMTFVEKLKEKMKNKLDKKVEEENHRRLKGHIEQQPNEEENEWLEILHDGFNPVLPQLPDSIQTCLRGEQLPPRERHEEEAERIVNNLTHGRTIEYVSQLNSDVQSYKGKLSFFQLNPLWAYPNWQKTLERILWQRGPLGENPMEGSTASAQWKETFLFVNQRKLHEWAKVESGVPFRVQQLLLGHYSPPAWTCVYTGLGRPDFLYTRPQILITTRPESCTGEENQRPWPPKQEGFPTPEENSDVGLQKDVGFGDCQTIDGFDLRSEKIFSLQRRNISEHENSQMWPNKGSERPISYKIHFREYDTQILNKATVREPTGLNKLRPLYFEISNYNCDSMAASILAHFNLIGPTTHNPMGARYYRRISSNPMNNQFRETEYMRSTPMHFIEDIPYIHQMSGKHEPTMLEAIYDAGYVLSDQIIYSREHDDSGSWERVRFPNTDYLNTIYIVCKPKINGWSEEFQEEMHVLHSSRRIDMLSKLFPPDWRPLKYYQYSFNSSRKNRERCEKRKVFLASLTQRIEQDYSEYYRKEPITLEQSREEGTCIEFGHNRCKFTRLWMTFCYHNGLFLTNKNENMLVRINHTMRDKDLRKLLIHPGRDVNNVKRPFSMDL